MKRRDARLAVREEDILAELDAITVPVVPGPEPVTVAEFARTPETRQALGDVLPAEELEALERDDLERQEALTAIYQPTSVTRDPAHMTLVRETVEALTADGKANGWTGQRNRGVSAWRKTPEGRAFRSKEDRDAYVEKILENEDRIPRHNEKATPERRRDQINTAQAKRRANMTPEQREEEKRRNNEAKKLKRAADKAAKVAALKDGAQF